MNEDRQLMEVDGRRRVSLGQLARYDLYLAHVEEDGTIVLTPAVVMPAAEVRDVVDLPDVDRFLADPSAGTHRTRPDRPAGGDTPCP